MEGTMNLSFRKRQPIPELHIDEEARAAAAPLDKSDAPLTSDDVAHQPIVDQIAAIRLQEVRTLNDQRSNDLNQT
jgi:hypothetical protein